MSTLLARKLMRNLATIAKSDESVTKHLQVLKDHAGQKLAQKLYGQYCSQEDYSKYPAFCQELDTLLHKYGGDDNAAEHDDTAKGKKPPVEDNDDDGRDRF